MCAEIWWWVPKCSWAASVFAPFSVQLVAGAAVQGPRVRVAPDIFGRFALRFRGGGLAFPRPHQQAPSVISPLLLQTQGSSQNGRAEGKLCVVGRQTRLSVSAVTRWSLPPTCPVGIQITTRSPRSVRRWLAPRSASLLMASLSAKLVSHSLNHAACLRLLARTVCQQRRC